MEDTQYKRTLRCLNDKGKLFLNKNEENRLKLFERYKMQYKNRFPALFEKTMQNSKGKASGVCKKDSRWIWKHVAIVKKQIFKEFRITKGMEKRIWISMKQKIPEIRNRERTKLKICTIESQFYEVSGISLKENASICKLLYRNNIFNRNTEINLPNSSGKYVRIMKYFLTKSINLEILKKDHPWSSNRIGKTKESCRNEELGCCIFAGIYFNYEEVIFKKTSEVDSFGDKQIEESHFEKIKGICETQLQKKKKRKMKLKKRVKQKKFIPNPELELALKMRKKFEVKKRCEREKLVSAIKRYWKCRRYQERMVKQKKFIPNTELQLALKMRRNFQVEKRYEREKLVSAIKLYWKTRRLQENLKSLKIKKKLLNELQDTWKLKKKIEAEKRSKRMRIVEAVKKFWEIRRTSYLRQLKIDCYKALKVRRKKKRQMIFLRHYLEGQKKDQQQGKTELERNREMYNGRAKSELKMEIDASEEIVSCCNYTETEKMSHLCCLMQMNDEKMKSEQAEKTTKRKLIVQSVEKFWKLRNEIQKSSGFYRNNNTNIIKIGLYFNSLKENNINTQSVIELHLSSSSVSLEKQMTLQVFHKNQQTMKEIIAKETYVTNGSSPNQAICPCENLIKRGLDPSLLRNEDKEKRAGSQKKRKAADTLSETFTESEPIARKLRKLSHYKKMQIVQEDLQCRMQRRQVIRLKARQQRLSSESSQ